MYYGSDIIPPPAGSSAAGAALQTRREHVSEVEGMDSTRKGSRAPSGDEIERVFEALRNAVLDQRLAPGLQLKEQALADAFGVNRSVVRQAFARLEIYRLVTHEPNRGVFVAHPSAAEGRDLFTARRYIEAAIVDLAVTTLKNSDITRLRTLVRREREAYESGDTRKALRLSIDFHLKLAEAVGNTVLASFLDELVSRTPLVVLAHRKDAGPTCTLNEHEQILDAIAARDATRARELMAEHIVHLQGRLALDRGGARAESDIVRLLGLESGSGA